MPLIRFLTVNNAKPSVWTKLTFHIAGADPEFPVGGGANPRGGGGGANIRFCQIFRKTA